MNELPTGWMDTTLGQLGEWSSGGTPSRKHAAFFGGEIPWVKSGDLADDYVETIEECISEEGLRNSAAKIFPAGSLLVAMYGATIGRTGVLKCDAATNQACAALIARGETSDVVPFAWKYLISKQQDLKSTGQGGAQPNISQIILKDFPIRLAPLREQRRIVAKIDSLSEKSKRARDRLDHVPRLVEKYRDAVLAAAFRGDLTGEWRAARGRSMEDSWSEVSWADAGETISGRAFPSESYCDTGVRLLRPGNLHETGTVEWSEKNTRYLPNEFAKRFPRYLFRGSYILVNLTAQSLEDRFLGRACLSGAEDEYLLNQRIALYKPGLMSNEYCLRVLQSPIFRSFIDEGLNSGSLIQHVHTKQLMKFTFPIAPREEQEEIVRRIETAFAWIDRIASEASSARKLIDRLDQAILSKAFQGELVPQDPNDEPASVLLERIRAERTEKSARRVRAC